MQCEICGEDALPQTQGYDPEALPSGEVACPTCLQEYWERILEEEGLGLEEIKSRR